MALTYNGVKVSVTPSKLPSGYVKEPITEVVGKYKTVNKVLVIDKTTFAAAVSTDGFNNLLTEIETLVKADLDLNFKTDTANFTAYSDFTDITTNQAINEQVYTTEAYLVNCTVTTYILKT